MRAGTVRQNWGQGQMIGRGQGVGGRRLCALLGVLVATWLAGCSESDTGGRGMSLTLLHINDHHSHLDERRRSLQLRNAAGQRVEVEVSAAGFARLATAMREQAAAAEHVLKLHAGDALVGTLFFDRGGAPGEADAALMNQICFDAMAVGNHEFDFGDAGLRDFIHLLHTDDCRTPLLSANVHFGTQSPLHPSRAPGAVQRSQVVVRDGQRIGIVGLTIAVKTRESASPDPGTEFEDEREAAQREIDALLAQGIDKIILLTHVGHAHERRLVGELRGVDVLIGGDSHSLLGPPTLVDYGVGTPAGPYAERLTNADGDAVCLAQAWEYGQVLGELRVRFDGKGRVIDCGGTPHVLIGDDFTVAGAMPDAADRAAFLADIAGSGFLRITAADPAASIIRARASTAMRLDGSMSAVATSSSSWPWPTWRWPTAGTAAPTSPCKVAAACDRL